MNNKLLVEDSLQVATTHGECAIQLCIGSVTGLSVKQRVDTLVISAFPGDYSATPTSVIGALQRDLRISVRQLARDKEEDLRKLFSCWWSKPLNEDLPYRRILCFEGSFKKGRGPPSTVSEVFRSLVSLTKNQDMTAMMPLLAAGDQGYDDRMMLRLLVDSAVSWMEAGLPLKLLKIVLFSRKPESPSANVKRTTEWFKQLKTNWVEKWKEKKLQPVVKYDVYLSYCPEDNHLVHKVASTLLKKDNALRIFDEHQPIDENSAWQEQIHMVMTTCVRVVALLTPNYLSRDSCIEQFNIAMCCSREKNILVPFYMVNVTNMPTYMGLIQYMDCRAMDTATMGAACDMVAGSLPPTTTGPRLVTGATEQGVASASSVHDVYDIFVSYSHRDTATALIIVNYIRKAQPQWNVFFDQKDLKVGSTWQLKLYASIENTGVVLALVSDNYMESKVCQEEYNLARCLNDDPSYSTKLVQIQLSRSQYPTPVWCSSLSTIQLTSQYETDVIQLMSMLLDTDLVKQMSGPEVTDRAVGRVEVAKTTCKWREVIAKQKYPLCKDGSPFTATQVQQVEYETKNTCDVFLSYHSTDEKVADMLIRYLKELMPNLNISSPEHEGVLRLHEVDDSSLIVVLLSPAYITSSHHMEEFHTALCRHRFAEELLLFPIIVEPLPPQPVYPHLVITMFSITDDIWKNVEECLSTAAIVVCNVLVREPRVMTAFRTLLSLRELSYYCNQVAEDLTPSQLPIIFYSTQVDGEVWCLDENGNAPERGISPSPCVGSVSRESSDTNCKDLTGDVSPAENQFQPEIDTKEVAGDADILRNDSGIASALCRCVDGLSDAVTELSVETLSEPCDDALDTQVKEGVKFEEGDLKDACQGGDPGHSNADAPNTDDAALVVGVNSCSADTANGQNDEVTEDKSLAVGTIADQTIPETDHGQNDKLTEDKCSPVDTIADQIIPETDHGQNDEVTEDKCSGVDTIADQTIPENRSETENRAKTVGPDHTTRRNKSRWKLGSTKSSQTCTCF